MVVACGAGVGTILGTVRPRRLNSRRDAEFYEQANLVCSEIILADSAKYPPDSLPVVWARIVPDRDRQGRINGATLA